MNETKVLIFSAFMAMALLAAAFVALLCFDAAVMAQVELCGLPMGILAFILFRRVLAQ